MTHRPRRLPVNVLPVTVVILAALGLSGAAVGVPLDDERLITIPLEDGTVVTLLPEAKPRAPGGETAAPPTIAAALPEDLPIMSRIEEALAGSRPAAPAPAPPPARTAAPPPATQPQKARLVMPWRAKVIAMTVLPRTDYYYLPANLRLSSRPDGTPEFLFMKFTTEERVTEGGVQGGILHFLMEWGLTPAQERELEAKLREKEPTARLAGAAPLDYEGATGSFQIVSATLSDTAEGGLTHSVTTSGKAPLVAGGKCAAAARLGPEGAQLLDATFERTSSITDVSVVLNYAYTVLTPAARGWIRIDWARVQAEYDSLAAEYERKQTGRETKGWGLIPLFGFISSKPTYSYSYDEMRERYNFLVEKNIVDMHFEELIDDERVEKFREAFFQYFLNTMTEPSGDEVPPPPAQDGDKDEMGPGDIRRGDRYHFNRTAFELAFNRKTQVINMNYRTAIKRPFQIVANLASWYDGVRDNPRCVSEVNLNDPFFQHRDIRFILDLDAKEMFEEAVNYVTVNVRKNRDTGRPFEDHVTMDARYLQESGITAVVTYARGNDRNPDVYEYQAQWSLRGGQVYPADPPWERGSWEGVTLAPPVAPRTIEFEADLDEMEASEISRITAQVRYHQFGEEAETNLHISPARREPLVSQRIFTDRRSRGYAYRLVFNHRRQGRFVTPWQPKINDDYIYAVIPEDLFDKPIYKTAAEQLERTATEAVLDKFSELLGGITP